MSCPRWQFSEGAHHGLPRALVTLVRASPIAPTSRDPDGDHVLACALAASAELIVARDRDREEFQGIRILPTRAALAVFPGVR